MTKSTRHKVFWRKFAAELLNETSIFNLDTSEVQRELRIAEGWCWATFFGLFKRTSLVDKFCISMKQNQIIFVTRLQPLLGQFYFESNDTAFLFTLPVLRKRTVDLHFDCNISDRRQTVLQTHFIQHLFEWLVDLFLHHETGHRFIETFEQYCVANINSSQRRWCKSPFDGFQAFLDEVEILLLDVRCGFKTTAK